MFAKVALAIVRFPKTFVRAMRLDYWINEYKDTVEKPFVCPNCGQEF